MVARGATIEAATAVPQLPAGLPSGLLERRPDIRRAEALLAASDLRIQQARADYFPSLSLTAAYGTESAALSNLFTPPAAVWRFGAGLLQPLLALKAIESKVEAAKARRDEVTVEYQQTVQTAFREVHDALVTNRSAGEVLAAETERRDQLRQARSRRRPALRRGPHVVSSRCSTRSARCSRPRRCASRRRAIRGCRSSISRRRSAAAGTARRIPRRIEALASGEIAPQPEPVAIMRRPT